MIRQSRLRACLPASASLLAAVVSIWSVVANSQEGFPLDGTWRGYWGLENEERTHVVIVMKWNGETVTGQINPGRNSIPFADARLEPSNWGVHIEAETADGESIRIDGTLENIGLYNRYVVGTWQQGESTYPFRITRE
jgi:hypothetical protein